MSERYIVLYLVELLVTSLREVLIRPKRRGTARIDCYV
jgi:hypothetical protein